VFIIAQFTAPVTGYLGGVGFICANCAVFGATVNGTFCAFVPRRQNSGQNHKIKIAAKSFGIAAKLKYGYLGITLIKSELHVWGN
jgi:hypothetical protein